MRNIIYIIAIIFIVAWAIGFFVFGRENVKLVEFIDKLGKEETNE